MTAAVAVGRVSDHGRAAVESEAPLRQVGRVIQKLDDDHAVLVQAVRQARVRGYSWARIGAILGVTRQAAQQRFGAAVADEKAMPAEAAVDATAPALLAPTPAPPPVLPPIAAMTNDEIIAMAKRLPDDVKLYDPYLRALREAIVVTLYKRDMSQTRIAAALNKSPQRISQIVGVYYKRMEQEWAEERARRNQGEAM